MLTLAVALSVLSSCSPKEAKKGDVPLVDADGNTFYVSNDFRVVCAYGSFAECWLLSGGELVGVTDDAINERGLDLPDNTAIVGSVKSIDLERLLAVKPDLVILSADLTAHRALALQLADRGINAALFRVDSFDDYASMMKQFCAVNGGDELYKKHVTDVKADIERIKASVGDATPKEVLIMRAYANGIKVKTDNLAESIACDLGCVSLAQKYPSMLTDLGIEAIVSADPDVILVLTMGDEAEAVRYLNQYFVDNPALSSLSAVKNGKLCILPKELFHYKPTNKWNESYEYLAKILHPEKFN